MARVLSNSKSEIIELMSGTCQSSLLSNMARKPGAFSWLPRRMEFEEPTS